MNINKYTITKHAAQRMAQRNVSIGDLAIVLKFGRKRRCTGGEIFFLGERNLPKGSEKQLARLVGTFVIVVNDCVMTVIRNRKKGSTKVKRKPKRAARTQSLTWASNFS